MKQNPSIVSSGNTYRLYDSSVLTHEALPVATYKVQFNELSGFSLLRISDLGQDGETVYGKHHARVERTIRTYGEINRSLGVLLSGDKGMGKSLMVRMLAEEARNKLNLPTIIVDTNAPGIADFIDQIGEALLVFDEFEKVFTDGNYEETPNQQNQFLSLFDGISDVKRMYLITVNKLELLSPYFVNRPGRFHYHLRFDYPSSDEIRTYFKDQAPAAAEESVEKAVVFSQKTPINYDHLRALAFELERGEDFNEIISELNIKRVKKGTQYKMTLVLEDGRVASSTINLDLFTADGMETIYFMASDFERWNVFLDTSKVVTNGDSIIVPSDAVTVKDPERNGGDGRRRSSLAEPGGEVIKVTSCTLTLKRDDDLSYAF